MSHRILVGEDEEHARALLEIKLRNSGYEVITAVDGESSLNKALALLPDLIILDIMMPTMTGFEVLSALKQNPTTADIPIILVSAQSNEENIVKGLQMGAKDYIVKPFSPHELIARVKTVLLHG
jgi:DNA-binding response OmpR family regulator